MTDSRDLARLAARVAASKQGEAVVVLDVRELITITDYFVIASGSSDRQVTTIAEEILLQLKKLGHPALRR
ncbi:MAG: RsfS/YbeB/iojap family protein, partial [Actinobacteria bacterium]